MSNKKQSGFLHDMTHPVLKWGYIFVLPGIISYLLFIFYPTMRCFVQSIHLIRGAANPWVFYGFENYRAILKDKVFWGAFRSTFLYVLMTVPFGTFISLVIAINLNSIKKHRGIIRSLYFIPSVAGIIAIGIVFTWMYEPYSGLFNLILSKFGISRLNWLRDVHMALPSIAAMTIWRTMGYNVVILLAGLLAIPKEFYESAEIDGAGPIRKHISITVPLVAPAMWFVIINNTIQDLQVFSEIFIMTGGGPGNVTITMGFRIYQEAFQYFNFGKASAIAVVLLIIILIITIFQFRYFEEKTRFSY